MTQLDAEVAAVHEDAVALKVAVDRSPTTLMAWADVEVMVELVDRIDKPEVVPNIRPVVDVAREDPVRDTTTLVDVDEAKGDRTNPVPPAHDTKAAPTTMVSWRMDDPATLITVLWAISDDVAVMVIPELVTRPPTRKPLPTDTVLAAVIRNVEALMLPATLTKDPTLCVWMVGQAAMVTAMALREPAHSSNDVAPRA
jgi:hypothetical protein